MTTTDQYHLQSHADILWSFCALGSIKITDCTFNTPDLNQTLMIMVVIFKKDISMACTSGLIFLHLTTSVSRLECQQTFASPSKCYTFFIYNRQGIKAPSLRTLSQLHNVFSCPHFTVCVPFIQSSWRGRADSLSSAARPLCLISVIQLMRLGPWQAAGTHTKGNGAEMCP